MKKLLSFTLLSFTLLTATALKAQDKAARPSPPDTVTQTTASGLTITIAYSQPSVKGRTIGNEIAPYGKVWRTGANEATTIELSKDAMVQGQKLAAGKYSLYTIPTATDWTIIFNKTWKQWGLTYKEDEDVLRVKATSTKSDAFTEKMTFSIDKKGTVSLMWGDVLLNFTIK